MNSVAAALLFETVCHRLDLPKDIETAATILEDGVLCIEDEAYAFYTLAALSEVHGLFATDCKRAY